jgi:hypothetical protein
MTAQRVAVGKQVASSGSSRGFADARGVLLIDGRQPTFYSERLGLVEVHHPTDDG